MRKFINLIVKEWIDSWEIIDEDTLFERSLLIEPRKLDHETYERLLCLIDDKDSETELPERPTEVSLI